MINGIDGRICRFRKLEIVLCAPDQGGAGGSGVWIFVSNVYGVMVSLARKEFGFKVFFI
jgi:hypothetical protein